MTPVTTTIELRVLAQKHIQTATEEEIKAYMEDIIACCQDMNLEKYVLRSSGMSVLLGAKEDLKRLKKWVEVTRRVQNNLN